MIAAQTTICAIATPAGIAARGIVRMSGRDAVRLAGAVFEASAGKPVETSPTYTALEGHVRLRSVASPVPGALYLMRAPYSYTREDVVEMHLPGCAPLLQAALDELVARGAELAAPGEFTKRAYLNGRIDLTQAEAVAAAIQSNTQAERRLALEQLRGRFGQRVREIQADVLRALAEIEADLDFSDQEIELISDAALEATIADSARRVEELLARARIAPINRDAVSVTICGRPNVGKSSLLNRLAGRERAIVSDTSGTTRDLIDDLVEIDGIHFRLTDTPGLAEYEDAVAKQAAARGRQVLGNAQIALLVVDRSQGLLDADMEIRQAVRASAAIVALNKSDLPPAVAPETVTSRLAAAAVPVSCRTGAGIPELRQRLARTITSAEVDLSASLAIANARHKQALERSLHNLTAARHVVAEGMGRELAAIELRDAAAELGVILGEVMDTPEEVLDLVFSQFCIGK